MENKESVLVFWDANYNGVTPLINGVNNLLEKDQKITTIFYLICEYIYNNDELKDKEIRNENKNSPHAVRRNAKERISYLENYYEDSSIKFKYFKLPSTVLNKGQADNLKAVENAIITSVFPELIKLNPSELHLPLLSGTQSMRYAWLSLYTKSLLTRSFGNNVHIWQNIADRSSNKKSETKNTIYELEVDKNPFIDSIEKKSHESKTTPPINLDFDGKIQRNATVDVPLLVLGERGIGKSTIVESTIVPTKMALGHITNSQIQTVVCGQLDSELAADELFGHEKGAYTGAEEMKKGKIELANNGLLFMDEIQDLPRNIQRQLLRALQEKKFNRIGQKGGEVKSDFKLVCASNNSLSELQKKLDPDFFDRIATFKTYLKPLREQTDEILEELWNNRWQAALAKGFQLPAQPDDFNIVKETLKQSKMYGNIRDIEQLIAYIARDVYQGTSKITEVVKASNYEKTKKEWLEDYQERYHALTYYNNKNNSEAAISIPEIRTTEEKKESSDDIIKDFLEEQSWKDINVLFKNWLSNTATEYFGSRKEAAKKLRCEEKTLYNAIKTEGD